MPGDQARCATCGTDYNPVYNACPLCRSPERTAPRRARLDLSPRERQTLAAMCMFRAAEEQARATAVSKNPDAHPLSYEQHKAYADFLDALARKLQ